MYRYIFFDLDGTLTDSKEGILNCLRYAFEKLGEPAPPESTLIKFIGPPLQDSFMRFCGFVQETAIRGIDLFRERYVPIGKFENTPYPGIRELLEKLRAQGHRLYVATSKPENMSVEILEHFDLAKYFDHICGASLDRSRSSKDAVIAYLLEQYGKDEEMIMVGDTVFDILGAAAHAIPAVGVTWGYGSPEEMIKAGAAAIAPTMDALLRILQSV